MADKEFKVKYTAKDEGFSAVSEKVKKSLDDIGKFSGDAVQHFTGGFLGGTAAQTILNILDRVVGAIRETAALAVTARGLGITTREAVGTHTKSRFMGLQGGEALNAQGAAQQARAEALAGDPDYIKSFKAFGISMEELAAMRAKDVFDRVADAFQKEGYTPATKLASGRILGRYSETLAPFLLKNGSRAFRGDSWESTLIGLAAGTVFGHSFNLIDNYIHGRNRKMADYDPTSTRSEEENEATRRLATANRQREVDLARSQLPLESQLNELVRERLEMQRDMDFQTSPLDRERLRARILDSTGQIYALRGQIGAAEGPTGAHFGVQRNLSDLYRSGIFAGGRNLELGDQIKRDVKDIASSVKEMARRL